MPLPLGEAGRELGREFGGVLRRLYGVGYTRRDSPIRLRVGVGERCGGARWLAI
jgi:hypothetical protein